MSEWWASPLWLGGRSGKHPLLWREVSWTQIERGLES